METIYGILESRSTFSLTFPSTETERDIENMSKEARVKLLLIVTNESINLNKWSERLM